MIAVSPQISMNLKFQKSYRHYLAPNVIPYVTIKGDVYEKDGNLYRVTSVTFSPVPGELPKITVEQI